MRYLLFLAMLLACGAARGQGSGFTFNYNGPSQILVGPTCEAPLNWGHPNTPTVTSNIPGGMIISFGIYSISGGYAIGSLIPGGTTVTVFYQALDNFGNSALFGFTIAFVDLLPPVFDPFSLPSNITISCSNNVPPPANVEATDNCDNENANLTITYAQTGNPAICTGGTIKRTWVADDDLGNLATFIQTITVTPDVTPPVIANNLQNGMAPCATAMAQYTTWLNAQRAAFSATDAGCGVMTLSDNAPSPAIITSFCGVIDVTFTAKDNCNNTSTVNKTFTVTNNVAPVITTPASGASGNCSQANITQVFNTWITNHGGAAATDDCSSIFWSTSPATPSIHDTCDAAIVVLFIASDGCNNFDTTTASFILTDETIPAITKDPTTIVLSCSAAGIDSTLMDWLMTGGNSKAHDLCTSDEDLALGYRIGTIDLTLEEVLDAWQDSLASGCHDNVTIGGIGINNVKAYLPVRFTYTDNCENENGKIGYFGITDNGRPVFDALPSDTSFACAEDGNWETTFLGWYNAAGSSTYSDLCSSVTVQPSITADSAIQYLTAALDTACMQGVSVTISFGLTDECGNMSLTSPSASFSLQDTTAPVLITAATDILSACSENAQTQLQNWIDTLGGAEALDGCGALMWQFMWNDTSGMPQTGVPGIGPYPQLASLDCSSGIEIAFLAKDICQNSVSDTASFSVIDTIPPVILIPEDSIHLTCQDTIPLDEPVVTDDCGGDPTLSFVDSTSVDSCLGIPEQLLRTWTAIDACGNSSTAQVWYFRLDTLAPTFELPPDTVAFCSVDTLVLINVSDNCDPAPVVTFTDQLTGLMCNQILLRTWAVTDACGNSTTAIQQFDLSDETPPIITYSPGNYVYTCDVASLGLQGTYEQWRDSVIIEDGCSDAAYFIALKDSYVAGDTSTWPGTPVPDSIMVMCGIDFGIIADLVAYDACGNVVIEEISFKVNDTVGPVFINCLPILNVIPDTSTCDALVTLVSPEFEEVCFPDDVRIILTINHGDTIMLDSTLSIDTLLPVGIHTAIWTAFDCNGNTGTCTTSIQIIAEEALTVICPSDTLLFTTNETCLASLEVYPSMTITGTCGLGVITWSGYIEGGAEPAAFDFDSGIDTVLVSFSPGLHTVFLIAQDSTGDADTCSYMVELRDTILPVVTCQDGSIILPPSGIENVDVSTAGILLNASDACDIDTVLYDPSFVNCANNGQVVSITITVIDQNGNSSSCQSNLTVSTAPLLPLWAVGLCDDTLRLFANLPDGPDSIYTFTWSGPNSYMSSDENPLIPDADTSYSGEYVLTIQSDNGCISTGTTNVLIEELNAPAVTVSPDTLCSGEEVTMSTQPYSGQINYEWYHQLPSGDTLLGSTIDPQLIYTSTLPGTYTVYAVVTQDTCTSEPGTPVSFVVLSVPVAAIVDPNSTYCTTDTLFLAPVSIVDSLNYHWTGPGGYEVFEATPEGIPVEFIDSAAVFVLTVSSSFCTSIPDSVEISVQSPPATPIITGDTLACEGGMFVLNAQSNFQSYEWIDPSGNSIATDDDSLRITSAVPEQSGAWYVIAFQNGCPSDTSEAFMVEITGAIQVAIQTDQQVCEGDSIILSITPAIAGAHSWTGPGGFASNEITPTTLAIQGTYYVSVMTNTGCAAEDSIDVNVDVLPVILSLMTDADSCANGTDAVRIWAISEPAFSGAFSYTWEGLSDFTVQDSSIVIDSATTADNGLYTLVIINGACFSADASYELDLHDSPAAPVISGENVYCNGDSIMLTIDSPIPGAMYSWTSQDTNVVINSPGTLIIPDATTAWSGVYSVAITIDGCTSEKTNKAVQVRLPLFAPSILSTPLVCEGDSLVLIANGPPDAMFQWIGPNGFESSENRPVIYPFTLSDAGTYQVFYTQNGCPSLPSNPYEIAIQASIPAPSIIADLSAVCIGNPMPVNVCIDPGSLVPGGVYTWLLNGNTMIGSPGTDSCITLLGSPLQVGINSISAIASVQGCPSEAGIPVEIIGDEIPNQNANAGFDIQVCPSEVITLNASNPFPATGLWTSNDDLVIFSDVTNPNADIIGLPSGTYELTWTLSYASCIDYSIDDVSVAVLFSPETNPDTVDVPFGQTTEFIVTLNDNISMGPYMLEIVQNPQHGNALHADNGIIRYTPNVGFVGTDMLVYRVCAADCPEECSESIVILKVGNEDDCFVPTLFTPNEDGVNDVLIVPCLETERYPKNKLIVFNEWGGAVYTASPYQNDWSGTYSGESLPVGTYFYIMDFGDGRTPKRSFLILER